MTAQRERRLLKIQEGGRELLRVRRVETLDEVMALRLLRNECREQMTTDTSEITEAGQLLWWQGVAGHPDWHVWLVLVPHWEQPVGFLMLRRMGREWFLTMGLRCWIRGQGYGTHMYRAALALCPTDVHAVIRDDNQPSIRAAVKAGYVRIDWPVNGQVAFVGRSGR